MEKVGVDLIKSKRIVFTPSVDIKKELAATSINITCIDRNGNLVKRVTSDAGEVEDDEDENGGGENNGGTNTGGNSGGDNNGGNNGGSGGFDTGD